MLEEKRRKQLDDIVKKMVQNKEDDDTVQFVVDDFKSKYDVQPVQKKESTLEKVGNIAGKGLEMGAKFTGVKSAVDLLATAGEGFQYVANKITGNKEANKRLLEKPQSEIMKKANVSGTTAGLKDVAGKSLEVALAVSPYAKGAKAVQFTGKLAEKFPTIARYAGYGAQGAKYGGGFGVSQSLQKDEDTKGVIKEAITGATTGALIGVAIPAIVEGTVRAAKNVIALYSGVPKDALERAFNNPETVGVAARKYSKDTEATQEILSKANKSFDKIKETRSTDYKNALNELQNKGYKPKIDKKIVKNSLDGIIKEFNPKVLSPQEVSKLDELKTLYQDWDDFTPLGLNDLRRSLRNRVVVGNSRELNSVITQMEKNLNKTVDKADPLIGEMRRNYAEASDFIEDLQKELFGKNSKLSDNTKLNRLLGIFSQKNDVRLKLVEQLGEQTGQDLLNEITGAAMSSWLPTGWVQRFVLASGAGYFSPTTLIAAPLASPRIAGKAARVLGQGARLTPAINKYGQPIINKLINK